MLVFEMKSTTTKLKIMGITLVCWTLFSCFMFHQIDCISSSKINRLKRSPHQLPADAKKINLGKDFKKTFKCEKDKDGFFADTDNGCKVFHRCRTANNAGKRTEVMHHSFICNKGLVFDQSTFTCTRSEDAIPCDASPMFYDLNDRIGSDGPFLTDADIERAKAARPQYRRARA